MDRKNGDNECCDSAARLIMEGTCCRLVFKPHTLVCIAFAKFLHPLIAHVFSLIEAIVVVCVIQRRHQRCEEESRNPLRAATPLSLSKLNPIGMLSLSTRVLQNVLSR